MNRLLVCGQRVKFPVPTTVEKSGWMYGTVIEYSGNHTVDIEPDIVESIYTVHEDKVAPFALDRNGNKLFIGNRFKWNGKTFVVADVDNENIWVSGLKGTITAQDTVKV